MANTNTYQAQANELSQKLWAIANELRGQMDASEFKNYILGVIFYRYLSERTEMYMAEILENDGVTYEEAFADDDYRSVVEEWSLTKLGYVIRPENLFRNLIRKITKFESEADRFSVEDFEKAINDLVGSTMGHESNKAFDGLFNDMRLDQDTVPKGLYLYEVRYDDETWEPVQIAKGILANHLGSILTRERLKIPPNGYLDLEAKTDWKYNDKGCRTVKEFLEKYPIKQKERER